MSLFLPTEVAQGDPGLTLWPEDLSWTLVLALGACIGGMSSSPWAWTPSNVRRSWETPSGTSKGSFLALGAGPQG